MYIKSHVGVQAWFKLVARKASDDSVARESVWFPNIVLDTGLDQMSKGTWIQYCAVGTGNSEPKANQTMLDSIVAVHNTIQTTDAKWNFGDESTNTPTYQSKTQRFRFNEGVAAGNLTEVSMGWFAGSASKLENYRGWNRALILDADGKPTTLTVLSDEYLDVFTEIRMYPTMTVAGSFDLMDKTGKVISKHTLKGIPYIPNSGTWGSTGKVGSYSAYSYTGGLPSVVTSAPTGRIGTAASSAVHAEYPNDRTCRAIAVFSLNTANGQNKCFQQLFTLMTGNSQWGYQIEVDPPIPKDSTQMLTFVSDLTWGRYEGG